MTVQPNRHYMQLNNELWLTADKRAWKIGKLVKRSNGKTDLHADWYIHKFDDLLKTLLELELKLDFCASDIVTLQLEHKKAVQRITNLIQTLADSDDFKKLCYLRNGVIMR